MWSTKDLPLFRVNSVMADDRYADPYSGDQYLGQIATERVHSASTNGSFAYGDASLRGFQANPSTEKVVEDSLGTERAQKGRQGVAQSSRSWQNGPPPRSTGILRMWRKGERGKQWSRVSKLTWLA